MMGICTEGFCIKVNCPLYMAISETVKGSLGDASALSHGRGPLHSMLTVL